VLAGDVPDTVTVTESGIEYDEGEWRLLETVERRAPVCAEVDLEAFDLEMMRQQQASRKIAVGDEGAWSRVGQGDGHAANKMPGPCNKVAV